MTHANNLLRQDEPRTNHTPPGEATAPTEPLPFSRLPEKEKTMQLLQRMASSFLVVLVAGFSVHALAQGATDQEPIYLDELEREPAAKIVKQETVKSKYEDDAPRMEAEIVRLSNDRTTNHGKYVEYYRNGKKYAEGSFGMGVHVGQWKYWYPNGQLCKAVTFKVGKPHGSWEVYRPDGSKKALKSYDDGMRDGKWISYFESSEQPMVELTYEKGKIVGERITYFENGQIRQQIPFEDGVMHGMVVDWDENGKKVSEIKFEQGKPVGKARKFDAPSPTSDQGG